MNFAWADCMHHPRGRLVSRRSGTMALLNSNAKRANQSASPDFPVSISVKNFLATKAPLSWRIVSRRGTMLKVNGVNYQLEEHDPSQSLATFLGTTAGDKSVKVSCASGSCGSCTVVCTSRDEQAGSPVTRTINACLAPIGNLAGCAITTARGLGNSRDGFHPIQERIGAFHASQCGFCTPGIVAACHAALSSTHCSFSTLPSAGACSASGEAAAAAATANGHSLGQGEGVAEGTGKVGQREGCGASGQDGAQKQQLEQELEHMLDGNLCRCTGYRPIVDALKSLAPGIDIEDLGLHTPLPASPPGGDSVREDGSALSRSCADELPAAPAELWARGKLWLRPASLGQLHALLQQHGIANGNGGEGEQQGRLLPIIVGGNTGSGLHKGLWPAGGAVVSVMGVREMRGVAVEEGTLRIGAAATITELRAALSQLAAGPGSSQKARLGAGLASQANGGQQGGSNGQGGGLASHFAALAELLGRVAGTHVRNTATVGGNLVLARSRGLESDIATALGALGATLHLLPLLTQLSTTSAVKQVPLLDYVASADGTGLAEGDPWLITHITLPLPGPGGYFWCHKVAPAYSNAHAIMNAAMLLRLSPADAATDGHQSRLVESAAVVFGYPGAEGSWACHRSKGAEEALAGRVLNMQSIAAAMLAAAADLAPAQHMEGYCRSTAQGLVLQALAPLVKEAQQGLPPEASRLLQVPARGAPAPVRGRQVFEREDFSEDGVKLAPVGEPIEKDRVLLQASGEAFYTGDIDMPAGGLHAAYVTSTEANAGIDSVDPSPALALPGVVAFFTAKDLPPGGNVLRIRPMPLGVDEPLFAEGRVEYFGQPLGLIVARSRGAAIAAASAVRVTYSDVQQPVLSISDAIAADSYVTTGFLAGGPPVVVGDPDAALTGAERRVRGRLQLPSQYHFYMETQNAMSVPDEGGSLRVHTSGQHLEGVQCAVAHTLGLRHHDVNVVCRRVGGGFGGKASRHIPVALASAVAASKTGKPVSLVLDRSTDMALVGGRMETLVEYDVGFSEEGLIRGVSIKAWVLSGAYPDIAFDHVMIRMAGDQCYHLPALRIETLNCRANLPPRCTVRAPGKFQATLIIEHIMDRVAAECGLDSAAVRERNFLRAPPEGPLKTAIGMAAIPAAEYTLPQVWEELKERCRYEERKRAVAAFNTGSPWVKRGIAMTQCRFDATIPSKPAAVSVFADGSILVYVGGIELGQGLTTKVKQVAVMELSRLLPEAKRPLPLDLVRMGDSTTYVLPNGSGTFGSTASESACAGVREACRLLAAKLEPFRETLGEEATWLGLVGAAAQAGGMMDSCKVVLAALGGFQSGDGIAPGPTTYCVFGAACSEVEVNVLTGERQVLRTDILMDCGRSTNPAIDIGQAEGAFVQGLGLVLSEEVLHDQKTGQLLTGSLWHYTIPTASAIPRQLNVEFLAGSRNKRGILGSKAMGEPPLLLSASAFSALQAALAAAQQEAQGVAQQARQAGGSAGRDGEGEGAAKAFWPAGFLGRLPASVERVKEAVGGLDAAGMLGAVLGG